MTADKPSPLVPKLRFPEFVDGPPWECPPLKKLAKRITQRNTHGADLRALTNSAERGVVDQREYFNKDIATNTDNYYIVEPGDYVYNPRVSSAAPVGPISKNKVGTGVMSPLYMVFRFRSDANDFFAHYFRSSRWHGYLRRVSNSGARHDRMAITNDDLMRMLIPTPSSREQEKIADCLGSLDDLIAAEGRKLEALRQHKQGLMQQLFPQPGETAPRLRFPEFQDAPEWDVRELGPKTTKVGSGITPTGGDKNYKQTGRPFVRSQNVGWGCLLLDDIAFIDEETHRSFRSTEIEVPDVLLNITGASIGRSAVADARIAGGNVNQHVCILRVKPKELNPTFLNQYLISQNGQKQIDSFQAGGNRQGLNFAQIRTFSIPLPPLLSEQQRIATCLGSLDDLIAAEGRKLEALRQHKQGLMQQLFPSLEKE